MLSAHVPGVHDGSEPCSFEELLTGATLYANVSIHVATHTHLTRYTIMTVRRELDSPMADIWESCKNPKTFHQTFAEGRLHHYYNCEHHCPAAADSHDLCINK